MAYSDGWAALHLDRPARVPRTEYSAEFHWPLISAVTGREVTAETPRSERDAAARAFMEAWDYAFIWSTLIGGDDLGPYRTRMGHAEYMTGREDYSDRIESAFADVEAVLAFCPCEQLPDESEDSLRERFERHYRQSQESTPFAVAMTGIYVTCISGLIDLFGWDLLLEAVGADPVRMGELTLDYGRWIGKRFRALASANVPVVMVHDDFVWSSGGIFHPDWYRRYVFPTYRENIRPLVESGKRVLFTADGDYTAYLDEVVATGVHGLVMEPMTDLRVAAERYGKTHVLVGNVDTRTLLSGPVSAVEAEVERCMSLGRDLPGFILAVGNHIPPNTPVDHALAYDAAYRRLRER